MKITELLSEDKKLNKNFRDASTGMNRYPQADTPYLKYRLGVMSAGAPDFHHEYNINGPAEDVMVSSHYTTADEEIMKSAYSKSGFKSIKITNKGSKETDPVNSMSPVPDRKKLR
jgi:hypothetical protein